MTGNELARKISTDPFPTYANQLLAERQTTLGFREFLSFASLELKLVEWSETEMKLERLTEIMQRFCVPVDVKPWMDAVKQALTAIGWYDSTDDLPWVGEVGCCPNCARTLRWGRSGPTCTWLCTACYRRWWCTGGNWEQVTNQEEWDKVRQGIVATMGRPAGSRAVRERGGRIEMPYRTLWPADFQRFDHGEAIDVEVPVSWGLHVGDEIDWDWAQFNGRAKVVKREPTTDDQVTCHFVKVS